MNMEYLRLFDAVAQAGSITGAAERLFASQPAISRQLARLERNLGVRLFDRLPRGVKLTRAGDLLRGYARRIFSTEVEAAEAIAEFRGLRRGRLHLGASLTIGSYLLPGILAQYCRGYPEIAVTLEIANTHDIQEKLLAAELDMAFTEGLVQSEELEAVVFAHDELIAVAPAGHAITRARRVTASRFCALPLILRERGSGTRLHSERALMQLGLQCRPILELGSAEAIKRAVRDGLGVAIMSQLAAADELRAGTLVRVPLQDLTIPRELHRVTLKGRTLSPAAQALWQTVQDASFHLSGRMIKGLAAGRR